jgi:hypothetical protein
MVRTSLGAYNTIEDIDALVEMLHRIERYDYDGQYYAVPESGDYKPAGHSDETLKLRIADCGLRID